MGANFARIKTWSATEDLTAADLNAEFDNILDNLTPGGIDDYSTNVTEMQATTDPGELGSESLATTLAGELERIRYVIAEMKSGGSEKWYETADSDLNTLNQEVFQELLRYFPFESIKGGQSGDTTDALAGTINRGGVINALSLSSADLTASHITTTASNVKFGGTALQTGSGGGLLAFVGAKLSSGTLSIHFKNLFANDYLAYNPVLGIEMYLDSSGFLNAKITERTASDESTKSTVSITGSSNRANSSSYAHALIRWETDGYNGSGSDTLGLLYDGSTEGTQLSSQTINTNIGYGGFWIIGGKRNDPTWEHFYSANGLPSAHTDAWSSNASGTISNSVSDGVLSSTATSGYQAWQRTGSPITNFSLENFTIDCKFRVTDMQDVDELAAFRIAARDDSLDRSFELKINNSGTLYCEVAAFHIDPYDWHHLRITTSGTPDPTMNVYLDGLLVGTGTLDTSDATANDLIEFGGDPSAAFDSNTYEVEYVSYGNSVNPIVAANTTTSGYLDDIAYINESVSDNAASNLSSSVAVNILKNNPKPGPEIYPIAVDYQGGINSNSATVSDDDTASDAKLYIPSDGVTKIRFYAKATFTIATATGQVNLGIAIDDELTDPSAPAWSAREGEAAATAGLMLQAERTLVPKVGLRTATMYFEINTAGTASILDQSRWLTANIWR